MTSKKRVFLGLLVMWVLAMLPGRLLADIRVMTWNISNYDGTNVTSSDLQNVLFGAYQGRTLNPDVIICQEFETQTAVNNFLAMLNTAQPNEWSAAPFTNGPDTDSAFFYRTNLFTFLGVTIAAAGSTTANVTTQPRNTYRYDIQLKGYPTNPPVLACYSVHMKSGSTSDDQARRLVEATRIRTNAESLPTGWYFLFAGDTNIQSASQDAYQKLVRSEASNTGRFFDPIQSATTTANWNNSSTYKFIHTQDPSGNPSNYGGMDDRLDMILLSMNMYSGTGLRYKGTPNQPYSTTTWNDLNHSYRVWGNDGTSFNAKMATTNNAMVGASIAQSIINAGGLTGHCPVYLDIITPPTTITVSGRITLESVANASKPMTFLFTPTTGTAFTRTVTPTSSGNYTLNDIPPVTYQVGIKGEKWLRRTQTLNATNGNVTNFNATLSGGDANNDNAVDISDLLVLINAYNTVQGGVGFADAADFTCDGVCDINDLLLLIGNYNQIGN